MNPYLAVPFLLIVSLLQSTLAPRMQIGAVWPDLPLLVVTSWALLRRPAEALAWAFLCGIVVDLTSSGPFGGTTLGLMLAAWIAGQMADGPLRWRTFLPIVTAFVCTLADHAVYGLMTLLVGQPVDPADALLRVALPAAVYNAALSWPIYRLLAALDQRIRPKALRW